MQNETNIELLNKLYASGDLQKLCKAGLCSNTILLYRNIYNAYAARVVYHRENETTGPRAHARTEIAKQFTVSEGTVERVVRILRP